MATEGELFPRSGGDSDGSNEPTSASEPDFAPLAERLRPISFSDVVGQEHLTGEGGPFRDFLASSTIPSMILWGPPGTGKTTIARVFSTHPEYAWEPFSAVLSGVKDVRAAVERARYRLDGQGRKTLIFVDEIHRFNKAQQDAFLPHVEAGTITLIGATTENPSFHVNDAVLSRCRVYVLKQLDREGLRSVAERALSVLGKEDQDGTHGPGLELQEPAWGLLLRQADGDTRRLLNAIEVLWQRRTGDPGVTRGPVTLEEMERVLQERAVRNLGAETHFDWVSALQKSIRGSDPHAAIYWVAQMIEAGEDPRYVVRRLVRIASEDVGLAEPGALPIAIAARDAVEFLGPPECHLAIAQCAAYLALAPKSNSIEASYDRAVASLRDRGSFPVPLRLRNAPTQTMKELGYGEAYRYAHDFPDTWVPESYLPDELVGELIYRPSNQGREAKMVDLHERRTGGFYGLRASDSKEDRKERKSEEPPS